MTIRERLDEIIRQQLDRMAAIYPVTIGQIKDSEAMIRLREAIAHRASEALLADRWRQGQRRDSMGWSLGYDDKWKRDIGYGVPAACDHPGCTEEIDRGLSFVCGGEPYGGEHGCGLFFCSTHLLLSRRRPQRCERCWRNRKPYTPKPELPRWARFKLRDPSWRQWRTENPEDVKRLKAVLEKEKKERAR